MDNRDPFHSKEPPTDREEPASSVFSVKTGTNPIGTGGRAVQHCPVASATGPMRNDTRARPDTRLYAVPFDGWSRELDEVLVEFCKRGRDGQRDAILTIQAAHPEIPSN